MELPTDRILLMVIVFTGFAVLTGAWISGFLEAQVGMPEEWLGRGVVALIFFLVVALFWAGFTRIDRKR